MILTLGVVLAQIINIATGKYYPWGWRVSLGLAGLPAIVLTIGCIMLPDTPNILVERGFEEEGRRVSGMQHASSNTAWVPEGTTPSLCEHGGGGRMGVQGMTCQSTGPQRMQGMVSMPELCRAIRTSHPPSLVQISPC